MHKINLTPNEVFLLIRALKLYQCRGEEISMRELEATVSAKNKLNKLVRKEVEKKVAKKFSLWPFGS